MNTSDTYKQMNRLTRLLWKRKHWILGAVALGLGGAVTILGYATPRYEAGTLVMVEPQKVPRDYIKSTIESGMEDRLRTLEQQITSRSNLERIIDEEHVYMKLRAIAGMEEAVNRIRRDLLVQVQGNSIFKISYRGDDPEEVARIANKVADLFIQENLRLRERMAENTTDFLEAELEGTKLQLEEQEQKVGSFRLRNEGSLPEQKEANLTAIAQLERKHESNRLALEQIEIQRLLLERQNSLAVPAGVEPPANVVRLRSLRVELQTLLAQYTEQHPDVIRLRSEIETLEKQVGDSSQTVEEIPKSETVETRLAQAGSNNLRLEEARLEQERQRLMDDISRYQRRLENTPRVGRELVALTRDYNNLQGFYESLLTKRIESRLAENLEKKQQSEQFRILEEAVPPSSPYYPNRSLFLFVGLALGGGIGIGIAVWMDTFHATIDSAETLRDAFPGVPFVVTIPRLRTEYLTTTEVTEEPDRRSA